MFVDAFTLKRKRTLDVLLTAILPVFQMVSENRLSINICEWRGWNLKSTVWYDLALALFLAYVFHVPQASVSFNCFQFPKDWNSPSPLSTYPYCPRGVASFFVPFKCCPFSFRVSSSEKLPTPCFLLHIPFLLWKAPGMSRKQLSFSSIFLPILGSFEDIDISSHPRISSTQPAYCIMWAQSFFKFLLKKDNRK